MRNRDPGFSTATSKNQMRGQMPDGFEQISKRVARGGPSCPGSDKGVQKVMTSASDYETYFRAFRDVIQAMYSANSLQDVLDTAVTKLTEVLNAKGALLRIRNKETDQFEVRTACGLGERYLTKGPISTEKLLKLPYMLHEVNIIRDIWNSPRVEYPKEKWDEGIRMMVDMPLAIQEPILGLMRIYFTDQREFSDDELDFIKTVAMHCTCVIGRVQLAENKEAEFNFLATQMEKLSSLGRMAAGIAHEINNPLAGILLFSSNMKKKVPQGSSLEEGLNIIIKETQRCKTIIQGLLDFAREKEPQKSPANVNEIMESALGIVENEFLLRHVKIRKEMFKHMVKTQLDENQIEQVLINLLLNALHAVKENGQITIRTEMDLNNSKIYVEISDNGEGIPPENFKKIFEPFFSTRANGTGLGLAVSYGIIQNHGGDIRVFSEPGRGTRFILEFPILDEDPLERNLNGNA